MAQDINWGNVETLIINQVTDAINESINMAKIEIDKNTPVDTGELIASNKVNPAKQDGDIIRGSVSNETEYGVYVEYGVLGRKYNYHK